MASNREQALLVFFLGAVIVAGGAFGGNAALKHIRSQEKILQQKEAQLVEIKQWLEEKPDWEARGNWLVENPLPTYESQQTEALFVQEIQASLSRQGIEIVEQRLQEPKMARDIAEVGIDMVIQGSLEQLVRWLHDVRRVKQYRAIREIRLKSDPKTSLMRVEVSVIRFYRTGQR